MGRLLLGVVVRDTDEDAQPLAVDRPDVPTSCFTITLAVDRPLHHRTDGNSSCRAGEEPPCTGLNAFAAQGSMLWVIP